MTDDDPEPDDTNAIPDRPPADASGRRAATRPTPPPGRRRRRAAARPPPRQPPTEPHAPPADAASRHATTAGRHRSCSALVLLAVGLWFFAEQTLGLRPAAISAGASSGRSSSSSSALWVLLGRCARDRSRCGPGWVPGDGSAADRLASPTGAAASPRCMPRSAAMAADGPGGRARALAGRPRAAVPGASAVAGPGSGPRRVPRAPFRPRPALRFQAVVEPAPPPEPGALAARAAEQRRGQPVVQPDRAASELPFPDGERTSRCSGWPAMRAGSSSRSVTPRTATRPTAPAATWSTPPRAPTSGGARPTRRLALILDFNFATQPSCAFDPRWACPLAPPENRLDLAIRAGERLA